MPPGQGALPDYSGKSSVTVRVGRMTVENVTSQEVTEFCASQFLLRCRPA
jgi:hypothetical protein